MYHFLRGLWMYATSKEKYSVLCAHPRRFPPAREPNVRSLLGLDNAGKTVPLPPLRSTPPLALNRLADTP